MMNFLLNDEQKMLQNMVRDFAGSEIEPVAALNDEKACFPGDIIKKAAELGLFGVGYPENYAGSGGGTLEQIIIFEEIARACAATCVIIAASNTLAGFPIFKHGNEQQKKQYLTPILKGEKIAAFALTEANAGSDVSGLQTTAKKVDGGYVLNGQKLFISNGAQAEIIVVFATTDKTLGSKGITAFIVENSFPGFSVGKHERKLGIRASSTTELIFDNCFVPVQNRLGEEGGGLKIAFSSIDGSRIGIASQANGISQAAFSKALEYSSNRRQFGQEINKFQAIQWMLADMATRIDAARLLTYRAAFLRDSGMAYIREASMAKVYASETAVFVTGKALQIHGGYGYIKDFPLERYYRDAKITEIYEGTSEIQRLTIMKNLI